MPCYLASRQVFFPEIENLMLGIVGFDLGGRQRNRQPETIFKHDSRKLCPLGKGFNYDTGVHSSREKKVRFFQRFASAGYRKHPDARSSACGFYHGTLDSILFEKSFENVFMIVMIYLEHNRWQSKKAVLFYIFICSKFIKGLFTCFCP